MTDRQQLIQSQLDLLRRGIATGVTMSVNGIPFNPTGDIVTLACKTLPFKDAGNGCVGVSVDDVEKFLDLYHPEDEKEAILCFGVWLDGETVSVDLNVVVSPDARSLSTVFAYMNGQKAIWCSQERRCIETGGDGVARLYRRDAVIQAARFLTRGDWSAVRMLEKK